MKKSLAQFELFKAKFTKTEPRTDVFYGSTMYVNEPAEKHPGFIWRDSEDDHQIIQELWGDGYLYTLLVWKDVESLKDFLYKSPHIEFMKRGKEWVHPISMPRTVLWWIPQGHTPCVGEAHSRLELLYEQGPSYRAFDLKSSEPSIIGS